ncbi:cyclic di-AMP binding protein CbpA [Dolosicoccus paucivorans]|uniref:cyclic di-AMP binding protein CbpA n=1 Tax=Dolosicoccus paucivorans TaxID=84521 RepID=UPI0008877935|nr:cyclic di-AMP binding protein CbpA [Dolosicoccus paucivorans]SDI63916.1 CBS domain-containing protein [Dolosicoccus paucivorans]
MISELMIPKERLICLSENDHCEHALQIMEDHHLRSAPILDTSGRLYRGNLYRYHIYRYFFQHPHENPRDVGVTRFLKNTSRVVRISDSLTKLLFHLRDLPYIAVLDDDSAFEGIVEHQTMLNFLSQGLNMPTAGYTLIVHAPIERRAIQRILKIVTKYSIVSAMTTINETSYTKEPYLCFVLPTQLDQAKLNGLIHHLTKRKYTAYYYKLF